MVNVSHWSPNVCKTFSTCIFWIIATALLMSGCAELKQRKEYLSSSAIETPNQTRLGKLAAIKDHHPGLNGFRLLPEAPYALQARISIINRAERAVDAQYYQIDDDVVGKVFLQALRDAGRRGVRVRLLVDDLYTARSQQLLLQLSQEPNVEVRLFNPFRAGRTSLYGKILFSLMDFDRANARMHNKLLVVDNAMAVFGGRNMANEYFLNDSAANFIDIDALTMGPIVTSMSTHFDLFWNSDKVLKIGDVVNVRLPLSRVTIEDEPMPEALKPSGKDLLGGQPVEEELEKGSLSLTWAPAQAFVDDPQKGFESSNGKHGQVLDAVRSTVRSAKYEVLETTPYLVPGKEGLESMRMLRDRGVRFAIVTNSLATTDEPMVHIGYQRYRKRVLQYGVELYELSSVRVGSSELFGMRGKLTSRLHGKTAVIDRHLVFLGSLNFDPRSADRNTELGVVIESDVLGKQMAELITFVATDGAYSLRLNDSGEIRWRSQDAVAPIEVDHEPETSFWSRFKTMITAPLVQEDLL